MAEFKDGKFHLCDEFLELLSMLSADTLRRCRDDIRAAKAAAEADTTSTLSPEAKHMMEQHVDIANQALFAIEQSGRELSEASLPTPASTPPSENDEGASSAT